MQWKICQTRPWCFCWAAAIASRSAVRYRMVAVRENLAGLGARPRHLRLRSSAHCLRLRTRARHQNGVGSLQRSHRGLPGLRAPRRRLLRCMNIPARYCTGYLGDIGVPVSDAPIDFAAWFEAYLGGAWYTFDARNNTPRTGRVLIARGRDAADVAITTTFGPNTLCGFTVVTEEITAEG